jgi:6-phosphogluconolactonase (cycloisomerase 2 family)
MKFSKVSQLALVSVLGLAVASLLSGCLLVSIDYIFVADSSGTSASSAGQIQSFAADANTGALRPIGTAIASGGVNPVSLATTADYANLYVANEGNSTLVHFHINGDGSLSQKDTVTVPFVPAAIAVNNAGSYLYVVGGTDNVVDGIDNTANGTGPGKLAVYPLSSGTIGALASTVTLAVPGNASDHFVPDTVNVLVNNSNVYVAGWDLSAYNPGGTVTSSANPGWVYGFSVGSGGTLTATSGSPYQAGIKPTAVISDPTNRFVYVTDYASNDLIGYSLQSGGVLSFLINGPFKTGSQPTAAVFDPRGLYIYVANALSNTVSGFEITLATGTPTIVNSPTGSGAAVTGTQPVSVVVDPALGTFVYTANLVDNSLTGFKLDPNTGGLTVTQGVPYITAAHPAAIAAVPHGNHAVQSVAP